MPPQFAQDHPRLRVEELDLDPRRGVREDHGRQVGPVEVRVEQVEAPEDQRVPQPVRQVDPAVVNVLLLDVRPLEVLALDPHFQRPVHTHHADAEFVLAHVVVPVPKLLQRDADGNRKLIISHSNLRYGRLLRDVALAKHQQCNNYIFIEIVFKRNIFVEDQEEMSMSEK